MSCVASVSCVVAAAGQGELVTRVSCVVAAAGQGELSVPCSTVFCFIVGHVAPPTVTPTLSQNLAILHIPLTLAHTGWQCLVAGVPGNAHRYAGAVVTVLQCSLLHPPTLTLRPPQGKVYMYSQLCIHSSLCPTS